MTQTPTPEELVNALAENIVLLIEGGGPLDQEQRERLTKVISGGIAAVIREAVEAEKEACARICEDQDTRWTDDGPSAEAVKDCATAIRARNATTPSAEGGK